MPNPTKYTPGYSYSDYQALNPTRPLPAPEVDDDFANISRSANETIDALADIRRSDGQLQNDIVTPDSISDATVDFLSDYVTENTQAAQAAAGSAAGSAATAATSAGQAMGFRNAAQLARDSAITAEEMAANWRDFAAQWATSGGIVSDGLNAPGYSARFWAEQAEEIALPTGSIGSREVDPTLFAANTPFGRAGVRVLIGEDNDAHYGLGSGWLHFEETGETVYFYRKGVRHGFTNGGEVWMARSRDLGQTLFGYQMLYKDAAFDTRPQKAVKFANGRTGFLCNRVAADGTDYDPILIYSDDRWATSTVKALARPAGSEVYSFSSHGGILRFPASQGGHDTLGFIAFGFMSPGGLDALTTSDNWETFQWRFEVATASAPFSTIGEWSGGAIGNDRWIFYTRNSLLEAQCFVTTNLLNWGPSRSSGVNLNGNPPAVFFDEETNLVHFAIPSRQSRVVYGRVNWLFLISADADALWGANGSFGTLGLVPKPVMPMPHWLTGYFEFAKLRGAWWATFVAGELGISASGEDGGPSLLCWIGDFIASGPDRERWDNYLKTRPSAGEVSALKTLDNLETNYPITAENGAGTLKVGLGAYGLSNKLGAAVVLDYKADIGGAFAVDRLKGLTGPMTLGLTSQATKVAGDLLLGNLTTAYEQSASLHIPVISSDKAAITTGVGSTNGRQHMKFTNPNGVVGSINTNGSAASYATTSDETFKDFIGPYDPQRAIDIIRRDPVRDFHWDQEHGGTYAVGWGAQTSHAVSPDLAEPGGWFDPITDEPWAEGATRWVDPITREPWAEGATRWIDPETLEPWYEGGQRETEDGQIVIAVEIEAKLVEAAYVPWGVDQGKRTPYLWAAVTHLLDRIEELERQLKDRKEEK